MVATSSRAFETLASVTDLVEFTVLDIEPSGPVNGKWVLADAQVAVNAAFRSSGSKSGSGYNSNIDLDLDMDMDVTSSSSPDQIFHTRTHLGGILQPGDAVLGYHLTRSNFNSDAFEALPEERVPDVILVRKTYPNRRKKNRTRAWRLKSMAKDIGEGVGASAGAADGSSGAAAAGGAGAGGGSGGGRGAGVIGRMGGRDQKKVEEDYELFLRDIEEDEEMRAAVNMYKAPGGTKMGAGSGLAGGKTRRKGGKSGAGAAVNEGGMDMDMDMEEDQTIVPPEETNEDGEEDEEEEADFPEVKLDELLDDFDEMTLQESEDN